MKFRILAILVLCAASLPGQITNYLGPAILSRGDNGIGTRGGNEDINIRPYFNVTGFHNTGLLLTSTDANGNVTSSGNQSGGQVGFGAYGRHNFRTSVLSLDYTGYYRYYSQNQSYNGTNQYLALGYTKQASRRVVLGFRQTGGILNTANAFLNTQFATLSNDVVDQTTQLFDNRTLYSNTSANVTYLLSPRTSITAGGTGFLVRRHSKALVGMNGWTVQGSMDHRLSAVTTVGVDFQHRHIDYPKAFGQTNINGYGFTFSHDINRTFTLSFEGGVYQVETEGQRRIQPDNAVQNLFGDRPIVKSYYQNTKIPRISIILTKRFRQSSFNATYARGVNNGNGVYLTSQREMLSFTYSLQGRRKWGASLNANANRMRSIGQGLSNYQQLSGGGTVNYQLTQVISMNVGFFERSLKITNGLNRHYQSLTFGFSFSPAGIPLSLY